MTGGYMMAEHDDRWAPRGRGSNNRRKFNKHYNSRGGGSWRGRGRGRGTYYPNNGGASPLVDQEGDFMMGGDGDQGPSRRQRPYDKRPMSRRGKRNNQYDKGSSQPNHYHDGSAARRLGVPLHHHSTGKSWFKVLIPLGKKIDKQLLLRVVGNQAPVGFRPLQFHYQGETAVFFLDNKDVADILRSQSKSLFLPDSNIKLILNVRPSSPPYTDMNEENKAKLTTTLSSRYDPSIKVLDLTSLHEDNDLEAEGLFFFMNRHNVAMHVGSIIEKNIPELVGLNVSKNRLLSLTSMQEVSMKAPNVTSLNLGQNQLRNVEELDKIKRWKLVELVLDGNPLCDKFSAKTDYIRFDFDVT